MKKERIFYGCQYCDRPIPAGVFGYVKNNVVCKPEDFDDFPNPVMVKHFEIRHNARDGDLKATFLSGKFCSFECFTRKLEERLPEWTTIAKSSR